MRLPKSTGTAQRKCAGEKRKKKKKRGVSYHPFHQVLWQKLQASALDERAEKS